MERSHVNGSEDLKLLRYQYYVTYRQCNPSDPYQNPSWLLFGNGKAAPKIQKTQMIQNRQNNLQKEEEVKGFTFPNFKTCYQAMVIKTVLPWCKKKKQRSMEYN